MSGAPSKEGLLLAERLRALRKQRDPNLTQQEAARLMDVPYRTLQAWELGTSLPRPRSRERLALFYGVSVRDLFAFSAGESDDRLGRIESKLDELLEFVRGESEAEDRTEFEQAFEDQAPGQERDERGEASHASASRRAAR